MVRDGLMIFNSVHSVMRAEKVLRKAGFDVRVMPVPRMLSSDCGLSLAFRLSEREAACLLLTETGALPVELYEAVGESYSKIS